MQTVLTIAGFDPSSGAGVTADLMVFAAHGLFGVSCITGLTVQSTLGVRATVPVSVEIVHDTLDCLQSDLALAGIKIGMLSTAENVAMVADFLEMLRDVGRRVPGGLDPVLRDSSGRERLDGGGVVGHVIGRREDLPGAARVLQAMGSDLNVVITGGDLSTPDDLLMLVGG